MGNGQPPVLIGCMLYYPNESKTMRRTIFQTRTIFRQQFVWFSNKGSKKDPWYVDCGERGSSGFKCLISQCKPKGFTRVLGECVLNFLFSFYFIVTSKLLF